MRTSEGSTMWKMLWRTNEDLRGQHNVEDAVENQ